MLRCKTLRYARSSVGEWNNENCRLSLYRNVLISRAQEAAKRNSNLHCETGRRLTFPISQVAHHLPAQSRVWQTPNSKQLCPKPAVAAGRNALLRPASQPLSHILAKFWLHTDTQNGGEPTRNAYCEYRPKAFIFLSESYRRAHINASSSRAHSFSLVMVLLCIGI